MKTIISLWIIFYFFGIPAQAEISWIKKFNDTVKSSDFYQSLKAFHGFEKQIGEDIRPRIKSSSTNYSDLKGQFNRRQKRMDIEVFYGDMAVYDAPMANYDIGKSISLNKVQGSIIGNERFIQRANENIDSLETVSQRLEKIDEPIRRLNAKAKKPSEKLKVKEAESDHLSVKLEVLELQKKFQDLLQKATKESGQLGASYVRLKMLGFIRAENKKKPQVCRIEALEKPVRSPLIKKQPRSIAN